MPSFTYTHVCIESTSLEGNFVFKKRWKCHSKPATELILWHISKQKKQNPCLLPYLNRNQFHCRTLLTMKTNLMPLEKPVWLTFCSTLPKSNTFFFIIILKNKCLKTGYYCQVVEESQNRAQMKNIHYGLILVIYYGF